MPNTLSWNEIRDRALKFSHDWKDETREEAEAKTFWDDFFHVFGVRRKLVATFEEKVRNERGKYGYIDLFWSGKLLVEHKSKGKDLDKAKSQAFQYIEDLIRGNRHHEVPRYVLISDFENFALYDLEPDETASAQSQERLTCTKFSLSELPKTVRQFAFIFGEQATKVDPEDPANFEAAGIMGDLHDALADGGFNGPDLERFLVRVLFCLFAEDTGIFEPAAFTNFVANRTAQDGSDLGAKLERLFRVLDQPENERQKNLDEDLAQFPYVNGELFEDPLEFADFNKTMRDALLKATSFRWEKISPAIFGSMFQGVLQPKKRRQIGAHYTNERDILKVIRSLFLDDLWAEFKGLKTTKALEAFHKRLASLTFFDPACGCGNFLVITYREVRVLELEVLKQIHNPKNLYLDVKGLVRLSVEQFHGIELEEWPARIAEVALWLLDHQMNQLVAQTYGNAVPSIPLKKSPHIHTENALRADWTRILPPGKCSYIFGNPPFVGKNKMNKEQDSDMSHVAGDVKSVGLLDYVTGWYFKAAEYIQDTAIRVGFVSTSSICQGEQVGVLWTHLFSRGIKIHFAHRTFPWESEARGKAHVHVVIVGFAAFNSPRKSVYDYELSLEVPTVSSVSNISPYLIEGKDWALTKIREPICPAPAMAFGSMPNDGGGLLLTDAEKKELEHNEPEAKPYIRQFLGSEEFLHSIPRWCLWLDGISPSALARLPHVLRRVESVREARLKSSRPKTKELAATPTVFGEIRQPTRRYLAVPEVSSEKRSLIPLGFLDAEIIASNKLYTIADAEIYDFGVLQSIMHMAWMRVVTGRLESRYQYSGKIVYNNFPWPKPDQKQKEAVEEAAMAVLEARAAHHATLSELYDSLTMPSNLVRAHRDLDRAVERCYRKEHFSTERARVEYLFTLYEQITTPLATPKSSKTKRGLGD